MADFTITIGPVTSAPKTVTTAKALELVNGYLAAYGLDNTGTDQQKINLLATDIARHIREVANGQARRVAEEAAKEQAAKEQAEAESGDWQ